jgi:hypothetical protein
VFVVADNGIFRPVGSGLVKTGSVPASALVRSGIVGIGVSQVAIATADGATIQLYLSDDGGATWKLSGTTTVDTVDPIASLELAAMSGDGVAVLAAEQSSTAFRFAKVAVSSDRGLHWKTTQAPTGGTLSAANGSWWISGGVMGDQVFRSSDGVDWQPIRLPVPANDWTASNAIAVEGIGTVVPVTTHAQDKPGSVAFLASSDDGASWRVVVSIAAPASASGVTLPTAVMPDGRWVIVYPDGSKVVTGKLGVDGSNLVSPNGLPENVSEVSITSVAIAAVAFPGSCPGGKQTCSETLTLIDSSDGGQTWNVLT